MDGEGTFAHVLVATGHPGLVRLPEPCTPTSRTSTRRRSRSSAPAWLRRPSGGTRSPPDREVVSIRRREPLRRPLNVPRAYFSKRGLAGFHRLAPPERIELLDDLGRPSYPPGPRVGRRRRGGGSAAARLPGDRATGFRQGLARGRAPRRSGLRLTSSRRTTASSCSRRTRPSRPSRTTGERCRSRASPPSGRSPPPTRSPAPSTLPVRSLDTYVVHADRPHPVAPRRDAPPLLVALGIHRWWAVELVALMLLFGVALDVCVYDRAARLPARLARAAARAGRAGLDRARDAHARHVAGARAVRARLGDRAALRPRALPALPSRVRAGRRRARPRRRARRCVGRRRHARRRRRRRRSDPADRAPPRRRARAARDRPCADARRRHCPRRNRDPRRVT